jgi:hypothetical protein
MNGPARAWRSARARGMSSGRRHRSRRLRGLAADGCGSRSRHMSDPPGFPRERSDRSPAKRHSGDPTPRLRFIEHRTDQHPESRDCPIAWGMPWRFAIGCGRSPGRGRNIRTRPGFFLVRAERLESRPLAARGKSRGPREGFLGSDHRRRRSPRSRRPSRVSTRPGSEALLKPRRLMWRDPLHGHGVSLPRFAGLDIS